MKIRNKKKGLTLIEVLVSIAILGIIIAPIGYLGLSAVKNSVEGKEKQQGTYLVQKVLETIKPINATDTANLFNQLSTKFPSFVAVAAPSEGVIYYDSNGNVADAHNYKYRVGVRITAVNHDSANVNGGSVFNNIITVNSIEQMHANGNEYTINEEQISLQINFSEGQYYIYTEGDNRALWDFPQADFLQNNNIVIDIDGHYTEDSILKIKVENNTDSDFNLYINKPETTQARYTIINSLGRVNTFTSYEDNRKYVAVENSVRLDMTVYNSDGQQIAHLEQYKNLGE
ncbi:prepilin-type N-terminal cleavage/methylation domain-containing protein [Clostridium sp. YIM B02505]|uniref:Prepilin-type N-terminal cleavage/methylation domain-containing protein n=1 Tax=Clostridium yunnanense TaxID=2800325 RepID=A0ABS1EMB2_9CLOT|nr:prepilin-type N-terminal cleavage/methylation domain-containing protein [Clostridium yunnanense]MBK1810492.1 prepilin-type N-terminal cleavage/methylation domain-containing protein [Clostridium yunnanense]